jgi:AI2M/AI1M-like, HNH endonuclease
VPLGRPPQALAEGLQVTVERGPGKKPLVARWGGISLARRTTRVVLKDELPGIWRKRRAELVGRLMSGRCELCTTQTDVEVHHIRRLKDLPPEDRAPQPEWVRQMASRRRKALIVCRDCHDGRVARGISAPGSHRSRRNRLQLPGSCHPDHQTAGADAVHFQCANIRGYRWTIPCQHRNAFVFARSRLYLLRIQRIK